MLFLLKGAAICCWLRCTAAMCRQIKTQSAIRVGFEINTSNLPKAGGLLVAASFILPTTLAAECGTKVSKPHRDGYRDGRNYYWKEKSVLLYPTCDVVVV